MTAGCRVMLGCSVLCRAKWIGRETNGGRKETNELVTNAKTKGRKCKRERERG